MSEINFWMARPRRSCSSSARLTNRIVQTHSTYKLKLLREINPSGWFGDTAGVLKLILFTRQQVMELLLSACVSKLQKKDTYITYYQHVWHCFMPIVN